MANDIDAVPFTIQEEGKITGTLWFGKFKAKARLSMRDQLNRDKIRREMLGTAGGEPDGRALSIAIVLSELAVRLTETPEWWKEKGGGLDLEDDNIVTMVYDESIKVETEAAEARKKRADGAREELKKAQAEKADLVKAE